MLEKITRTVILTLVGQLLWVRKSVRKRGSGVVFTDWVVAQA